MRVKKLFYSSLTVIFIITSISWVFFFGVDYNNLEGIFFPSLMIVSLIVLSIFLITPGENLLSTSLWLLIYGSYIKFLNELVFPNPFVRIIEYSTISLGAIFFIFSVFKLILGGKKYSIIVSVFEKIKDAVFVWDKNGRLITTNNSAQKLLGYSFEELTNKSFREIVVSTEREAAGSLFESIKNNGLNVVPLYERTMIRKDGERIVVEESVNAIRDETGDLIYILEIARDISHRKKLEEALMEEREKFYKYFDLAQVMMLVLNNNAEIVLINQRGCEILGYSKHELIGKLWFEFIPVEQREEVQEVFKSIINGNLDPVKSYENYIVNSNGEKRLISWNNAYLEDKNGEIISVLSSGVDITEERKNQRHLSKMKEMYELMLDITTLVLESGWEEEYYQALLERLMSIITDAQAGSCLTRKGEKFEYVAAIGFDIRKLRKVSFETSEIEEFFGESMVVHFKSIFKSLKTEDPRLKILIQAAGGKDIKSTLAIPLYLEEKLMGALYFDNFEKEDAFLEDMEVATIFSRHLQLVLWKQKIEEKLGYLATHDLLTGTFKREAFMDIAEGVLRLSRRYKKTFSVLYLDFDNFKEINDLRGHDVGDEALIKSSEKIQNSIRESDLFARFGGDEFVILLPETGKTGAIKFAEKLRKLFEEPIEISGKRLKLEFSIGISTYPDDGENLKELIRIADKRMYEDKKRRKLLQGGWKNGRDEKN